MILLTWTRLITYSAVTALLTWGIVSILLSQGKSPALVPPTSLIVTTVFAVLAIVAGWSVRQYQRGKRPMDAQRGLRTVMFAQACAYAGATLTGGFLGYVVVLLPDWSHDPRREVAMSALLAALGAALLWVGGVIAERWCRVRPPEDKDGPSTSGKLAV